MTHIEKELLLYKHTNEFGKEPVRERIGRAFRSKKEIKEFITQQTDPEIMYNIRWEVVSTYVERWDR